MNKQWDEVSFWNEIDLFMFKNSDVRSVSPLMKPISVVTGHGWSPHVETREPEPMSEVEPDFPQEKISLGILTPLGTRTSTVLLSLRSLVFPALSLQELWVLWEKAKSLTTTLSKIAARIVSPMCWQLQARVETNVIQIVKIREIHKKEWTFSTTIYIEDLYDAVNTIWIVFVSTPKHRQRTC